MGGDNATSGDNQQETERDPQRLYARHPREYALGVVMRQSDPHGDMGSQAEMT